ncbi:MAG: cytochrome c [Bryobacteraceae bacterium]
MKQILIPALLFAASIVVAPSAALAQSAEPAGNVEKGKQLYMNIGCQACHGRSGQGVGGNRKLAPKPIPLTAATNYVRNPRGQMIAYSAKILSDADMADIWAYMRSIPENPSPDSTILKTW